MGVYMRKIIVMMFLVILCHYAESLTDNEAINGAIAFDNDAESSHVGKEDCIKYSGLPRIFPGKLMRDLLAQRKIAVNRGIIFYKSYIIVPYIEGGGKISASIEWIGRVDYFSACVFES